STSDENSRGQTHEGSREPDAGSHRGLVAADFNPRPGSSLTNIRRLREQSPSENAGLLLESLLRVSSPRLENSRLLEFPIFGSQPFRFFSSLYVKSCSRNGRKETERGRSQQKILAPNRDSTACSSLSLNLSLVDDREASNHIKYVIDSVDS